MSPNIDSSSSRPLWNFGWSSFFHRLRSVTGNMLSLLLSRWLRLLVDHRRQSVGDGTGGHGPPNILQAGMVPPPNNFCLRIFDTSTRPNNTGECRPKCWEIDLNLKKPHRMHQNSPFWDPQSKNFLGRGHCPLPRPLPRSNIYCGWHFDTSSKIRVPACISRGW